MRTRLLIKKDAISYSKIRRFALQESLYAFSDSFEDEINKTIKEYEQEIEWQGFTLGNFTLCSFNNLKIFKTK